MTKSQPRKSSRAAAGSTRAQERRASPARHLSLLDLSAERGGDLLLAAVGEIERRVDEHHVETRRRRDLRDPAAHLSGAEDADGLRSRRGVPC